MKNRKQKKKKKQRVGSIGMLAILCINIVLYRTVTGMDTSTGS